MRIYQVTLGILDFDEMGEDGIRAVIDNARWPNHCLDGLNILSVESRDIGEWNDDHPLNNRFTHQAEWNRLFASPPPDEPEGE